MELKKRKRKQGTEKISAKKCSLLGTVNIQPQVTLVRFDNNEFCPTPPLFNVMDNMKLDWIPTKIK